MEKLAQLLDIGKMGNLLNGIYADSFLELFGFVSWLAIVVSVVSLFGKIPLINQLRQMMREDAKRAYTEADLTLEILPNSCVRYQFYRLLMYCIIFLVFSTAILIFYLGSLAILALVAKSLGVNKFTAFAAFLGLAGIMIFCMKSLREEANKLARFLRQRRAQPNKTGCRHEQW